MYDELMCKSLKWAINCVGKWSHLFLGKNKVNQRIDNVFEKGGNRNGI
jgi:hypothetical protein